MDIRLDVTMNLVIYLITEIIKQCLIKTYPSSISMKMILVVC